MIISGKVRTNIPTMQTKNDIIGTMRRVVETGAPETVIIAGPGFQTSLDVLRVAKSKYRLPVDINVNADRTMATLTRKN